jgi:DNA-binding transcriptional ArsR family regulator
LPRHVKRGRAKNSRGGAGAPKPASERKGGHKRTEEQRVSHLVNHPVRLDSFVTLSERIASPNELSAEQGVPLGTVSHHVTELAKEDLIELVDTVQRRGALEHFYRAKARPEVTDAEWQKMTRANRRRCAGTYLATVTSEALSSLRHGCMENDPDLYVFWVPLKLSATGRRELHEINADYQERIEALKKRDGGREVDDDTPVRFVSMLGFERRRPGAPGANAIGRSKG